MKIQKIMMGCLGTILMLLVFYATPSLARDTKPDEACELPENPTQSECESCQCAWSNGSCDCSVVDVEGSGNDTNSGTTTTTTHDAESTYHPTTVHGGSGDSDAESEDSDDAQIQTEAYNNCGSLRGHYDANEVADCYEEACINATGATAPSDGCYSGGCYVKQANCSNFADCMANNSSYTIYECANQTACQSQYTTYQSYQNTTGVYSFVNYVNRNAQNATDSLCSCYGQYGIDNYQSVKICGS